MRTRVFVSLVFVFLTAFSFAQNALQYRLWDGSEDSLALETLRCICFDSGQMLCYNVDGSVERMDLGSIRKLFFQSVSSIPQNAEASTVRLLMNPVEDQLFLSNVPNEIGQVSVHRIDGRLCRTYSLTPGYNVLTVSDWSKGFYLLKVGVQTIKMIKK
ncbi:MAG: T9SS type A sorting domain-containing protein [Bacteroidales bacterium]